MQSNAEDELAALLATLRREQRQRSGLDPAFVPPDEATAYRIAHKVADRLGWEIGGWKIAANKPDMQRRLRTSAPIYGRVFSQFIHESPTSFDTARLSHPIAECEYVVRLAASLPPRDAPYSREEVEAAVASIHPGVEVAECRFVHDEHFPPLPAILADGSGSGSLVLGPAIEDWRNRDIAFQPVILSVDGVEKRRGTAGDAVDHPLVPLTWLANTLSRTGVGLNAGDVISTGTCTGMQLARPGEEHRADFSPFGEIRITFR